MRYVLAIALILAAAVGLAWYRSAAIQADLIDAVEAALAAAEAEDVLVSADGLEVTLAGEVRDAATKERIDRAIAKLPKAGRFVNAVEVSGARASAAPGDATRTNGERAAATGDSTAGSDPAEIALSASECQSTLDAVLGSGSIDFASSSADLEASSLELVDRLVAALLRCGAARIEIGGHTDASGPRDENLELSLRRAETVKAYFAERGVDEAQLTAIGYGPDQPLVDNATPEGRAENRRIELKVSSQ